MWQEGISIANLNGTDAIRELDISKSYLYKPRLFMVTP